MSSLRTGSARSYGVAMTKSSGSTSSVTNSSIQSSSFWNCGSVSKSHAIAVSSGVVGGPVSLPDP